MNHDVNPQIVLPLPPPYLIAHIEVHLTEIKLALMIYLCEKLCSLPNRITVT